MEPFLAGRVSGSAWKNFFLIKICTELGYQLVLKWEGTASRSVPLIRLIFEALLSLCSPPFSALYVHLLQTDGSTELLVIPAVVMSKAGQCKDHWLTISNFRNKSKGGCLSCGKHITFGIGGGVERSGGTGCSNCNDLFITIQMFCKYCWMKSFFISQHSVEPT